MILYIARHGETTMNVEGLVQGITDSNLTEKGIAGALELKKLVDALNIDVVISSPLKRARDTAKILCPTKAINIDDRIIERDWGLREKANINIVDSKRCWDFYLNTEEDSIEKVQDLLARVSEFIEDIKIKYKDLNILIVTHSAVMRAMHYIINGIPEDGDMSKIEIPNLRLIEYKI